MRELGEGLHFIRNLDKLDSLVQDARKNIESGNKELLVSSQHELVNVIFSPFGLSGYECLSDHLRQFSRIWNAVGRRGNSITPCKSLCFASIPAHDGPDITDSKCAIKAARTYRAAMSFFGLVEEDSPCILISPSERALIAQALFSAGFESLFGEDEDPLAQAGVSWNVLPDGTIVFDAEKSSSWVCELLSKNEKWRLCDEAKVWLDFYSWDWRERIELLSFGTVNPAELETAVESVRGFDDHMNIPFVIGSVANCHFPDKFVLEYFISEFKRSAELWTQALNEHAGARFARGSTAFNSSSEVRGLMELAESTGVGKIVREEYARGLTCQSESRPHIHQNMTSAPHLEPRVLNACIRVEDAGAYIIQAVPRFSKEWREFELDLSGFASGAEQIAAVAGQLLEKGVLSPGFRFVFRRLPAGRLGTVERKCASLFELPWNLTIFLLDDDVPDVELFRLGVPYTDKSAIAYTGVDLECLYEGNPIPAEAHLSETGRQISKTRAVHNIMIEMMEQEKPGKWGNRISMPGRIGSDAFCGLVELPDDMWGYDLPDILIRNGVEIAGMKENLLSLYGEHYQLAARVFWIWYQAYRKCGLEPLVENNVFSPPQGMAKVLGIVPELKALLSGIPYEDIIC